jgi:hypothetical protein
MQSRRSIVFPSVAGGWAGCLVGVMLAPVALVLTLLIEGYLPPRDNDETTALIFGLCAAPIVGGIFGAIAGGAGGLIAGLSGRRDTGVLGGAAVGVLSAILLMIPAGEWNWLYTVGTGLCGTAGGFYGGLVMRKARTRSRIKGGATDATNNRTEPGGAAADGGRGEDSTEFTAFQRGHAAERGSSAVRRPFCGLGTNPSSITVKAGTSGGMILPSNSTTNQTKLLVLAHCPNDGMLLVLPESSAGRRITCYGCGKEFIAPVDLFGEDEWRNCQFVEHVIAYLKAVKAYPSPRKRRLLACAVCRLSWEDLDDNCRQALQVAERYADGLAGEGEREAASENALGHAQKLRGPVVTPQQRWAWRLYEVLAPKLGLNRDLLRPPSLLWPQPEEECALFREVVGDPFRTIALDPQWREWNGGTVTKLAEAIYQEWAFEWMPILADALEDAGCTVAEVLDHCRGRVEHVRGCWVVDWVLGRE